MNTSQISLKDKLNRINRIQGQVEGVKKMIDEGKYCIDIITQISAIRSALSSLSGIILQNHIEHCLVHAFEQQDKELQEKMIKEIMDIYKKHA